MLKQILKLEGAKELQKNEQQAVNGGSQPKGRPRCCNPTYYCCKPLYTTCTFAYSSPPVCV